MGLFVFSVCWRCRSGTGAFGSARPPEHITPVHDNQWWMKLSFLLCDVTADAENVSGLWKEKKQMWPFSSCLFVFSRAVRHQAEYTNKNGVLSIDGHESSLLLNTPTSRTTPTQGASTNQLTDEHINISITFVLIVSIMSSWDLTFIKTKDILTCKNTLFMVSNP